MRLWSLLLNSSYADVCDHLLSISTKPKLFFSLRTDVQIELGVSGEKTYFSLSAFLPHTFEIFLKSGAGLYILLDISHPLFVTFNQYPDV